MGNIFLKNFKSKKDISSKVEKEKSGLIMLRLMSFIYRYFYIATLIKSLNNG